VNEWWNRTLLARLGQNRCGDDRRRLQPGRRVTQKRALVWLATIVGLALIALAIVYWVEPAKSLPTWLPGHEAGSGHHHVKHGIASLLVGLACLAYAWFQTGGSRARTA
jgi:hypothetical protein